MCKLSLCFGITNIFETLDCFISYQRLAARVHSKLNVWCVLKLQSMWLPGLHILECLYFFFSAEVLVITSPTHYWMLKWIGSWTRFSPRLTNSTYRALFYNLVYQGTSLSPVILRTEPQIQLIGSTVYSYVFCFLFLFFFPYVDFLVSNGKTQAKIKKQILLELFLIFLATFWLDNKVRNASKWRFFNLHAFSIKTEEWLPPPVPSTNKQTNKQINKKS